MQSPYVMWRRFIHQIGWRKPVGDLSLQSDPNHIPTMGTIDMVAFGIGSCVGAGVFVTSGQIAAQNAGSSAWLSFMLAGLAAMLSGLCYSEFAARLPLNGGIYAYCYAAYGELLGFLIGWNMTLQYAISGGGIAISWANYLLAFVHSFGVEIPVGASAYDLNSAFNLFPLPLIIIFIVMVILLLGAGDSSKFNILITSWNISLICFIIIYGGTFLDKDNLRPMFPFGFGGVLNGAGIAFFSYIGFDAVSTMSAEAKNPRKDIPIGLLGSLAVAMTLYCLLTFVITGMVPLDVLAQPAYLEAPVSLAFLHANRPWATKLVAFGSVTTLTTTTLCSLMGQPQIFMPMAQDRLIPPMFIKTNKNNVPIYSLLITGIIAALLAFFLKFSTIVNAVSVGSFLNYSLCCAGTLVVRMTTIGSESLGPLTYKVARWRRPPVDSRITLITISAYLWGTWIFWFIFTTNEQSLAGSVVLGIFLMGIPMFGILYIYFFTEVISNPVTFNCPVQPFVPLAGIFVNAVLMARLPQNAYVYVTIWMLAGVLLYFVYGFKNSIYHEYHSNGTNAMGEMRSSPNSLRCQVEQGTVLEDGKSPMGAEKEGAVSVQPQDITDVAL